MSSAQRMLDQVQSLAAVDALAAAPERHAELLAGELAPVAALADLEARDAALVAALAGVEALAARVMKIRLDHTLAADRSIAPPTRKVFAQTVTRYAADLGLLGDRVRDIAARTGAGDADGIAAAVVADARATLAFHAVLHGRVLALVRDLSAAALAGADRNARDRTRAEPERRRWSAARRELEALAAHPARILDAPWPARLASWPDQLDEPEAEPPPSIADLIELD